MSMRYTAHLLVVVFGHFTLLQAGQLALNALNSIHRSAVLATQVGLAVSIVAEVVHYTPAKGTLGLNLNHGNLPVLT
jgi:hypothetical protein